MKVSVKRDLSFFQQPGALDGVPYRAHCKTGTLLWCPDRSMKQSSFSTSVTLLFNGPSWVLSAVITSYKEKGICIHHTHKLKFLFPFSLLILWLNLSCLSFLFPPPLSPDLGWMLPEVLWHLCAGDRLRGLVFLRVPPALYSGRKQMRLLEDPPQHHWHPGHLALLHLSHRRCGLHQEQRQAWQWGWKQVLGTRGPSSALLEGLAHPLCHEAGTALAGSADAGPHRAPMHPGIRTPASLPLCCHGTLFSIGLFGRKRTGSQAGVH